jgi:hypothetical protein
MTSMNYIGLDVHKKTISYCVKRREWRGATGRQDRINPIRAGLLDENAASAVDRGDGNDDLQRLDLRLGYVRRNFMGPIPRVDSGRS